MFRDSNPNISTNDIVKVINALSISGLIEMIKNSSGGLTYRAIKQEEASM